MVALLRVLSLACATVSVSIASELILIAGQPGSYGYSGDGGPATSAELYSPEGVARNAASRKLYISVNGGGLNGIRQ